MSYQSHNGKAITKLVSADGKRMAILRPYKRRQANGQYDIVYAWQCRFKGHIVIGGINHDQAMQYVTDAATMDCKVLSI